MTTDCWSVATDNWPLTMKQVVQNYRTGELKVEELPPPALRPGGVLVRTAFSLMFPPIVDEFGWDRGVAAGAFSFGFLV